MPQALGPAGYLAFKGDAPTSDLILPLITSGTGDVPEGTTSERQYVNSTLNPTKQTSTPAGPGSFSFTFDKNASAAIHELYRRRNSSTAKEYRWYSNLAREVSSKFGATPKVTISAEAAAAPAAATFTSKGSVNRISSELGAGMFLVVGTEVYVIDRITGCLLYTSPSPRD